VVVLGLARQFHSALQTARGGLVLGLEPRFGVVKILGRDGRYGGNDGIATMIDSE